MTEPFLLQRDGCHAGDWEFRFWGSIGIWFNAQGVQHTRMHALHHSYCSFAASALHPAAGMCKRMVVACSSSLLTVLHVGLGSGTEDLPPHCLQHDECTHAI